MISLDKSVRSLRPINLFKSVDSNVHWINNSNYYYPLDNSIGFGKTYPMGSIIQILNKWVLRPELIYQDLSLLRAL